MRPMKSERPLALDRRTLATSLSAATLGALLPSTAAGSEPLAAEPAVEEALAATSAALSPEQRLDVRNGVRGLQKTLADARAVALPYDVEPAFVFLP